MHSPSTVQSLFGIFTQAGSTAKPRPGGCCQPWERVSWCLPLQGSWTLCIGLPNSTGNSCAPRWVWFKSKLIGLVLVYVITATYICTAALCWYALLSGTFAIAGCLLGSTPWSICRAKPLLIGQTEPSLWIQIAGDVVMSVVSSHCYSNSHGWPSWIREHRACRCSGNQEESFVGQQRRVLQWVWEQHPGCQPFLLLKTKATALQQGCISSISISSWALCRQLCCCATVLNIISVQLVPKMHFLHQYFDSAWKAANSYWVSPLYSVWFPPVCVLWVPGPVVEIQPVLCGRLAGGVCGSWTRQ